MNDVFIHHLKYSGNMSTFASQLVCIDEVAVNFIGKQILKSKLEQNKHSLSSVFRSEMARQNIGSPQQVKIQKRFCCGLYCFR
jgi:hypothetical protein